MKSQRLLSLLFIAIMLFSVNSAFAQTTVTIGTGTSADYFFGPIYRSHQGSTFDYSRYHYLFTASELAAAGITPGATITSLAFYKNTTANIDEPGDAFFKIYMNNTSNTALPSSGGWLNLIGNSTLVVADTFNTTDNLPSSAGWMTLNFSTPFVYSGGSIEISTDWDIGEIFNSSPTNGTFDWRYDTYTAGTSLGKASNNSYVLDILEDGDYGGTERPNTQFTFTAPSCNGVTAVSATNITSTSADLSWSAATGGTNYNWIVVPTGAGSTATPVLSGTTANTSVSLTGLSMISSYDFYVQTDCGGNTSVYAGPYNFSTPCNGMLNGTYTVGGTGANFANVVAAANAVNSCGINGAVTFNIAAGTYTGAVNLASINGLNATNTITFDGGNATTTTITHTGSGQKSTLEFNGADYITVQNLTIETTGLGTWGIHLWNGADYITITNCTIDLSSPPFYSPIGIIATNSTTANDVNGNNANYTTINNVTFDGGYDAIKLIGNTSNAADNTNNTITNCTFNNVSYHAIYLKYQDNPIITGNTVNGIVGNIGYGIYADNCRHGIFEKNKLLEIQTQGIHLTNINTTTQTVTQRTIVANNMITTSDFAGIVLDYTNDVDIFYNSILSEDSEAIYVDLNSEGYNVRNNIFTTLTGSEVADFSNLSSVVGATVDYNIYHHFGGGNISQIDVTSYTTLAAWQTAEPTENINSLSGNPNFFSPTDLHVQNALANNVGIPIIGLTTDIDGDSRHATTPDIGVDEFIPTSCPSPLLNTLTATNLSFTSATLGWTAGGTETAWDVEWGLAGFTQGSGTMITATTNPHVLTNLTAQTSYEFYVRADCGNSTSVWVGPYVFYSGYCLPSPLLAPGSGIINVTMDTVNNTTGIEPNNYGDYTTQIANTPQALPLTISVTLGTGYAYDIWVWVDWNDDLDFDDVDEANYLGQSFAVNPYTFTGSLNVPPNAPLGNHRMRIGIRAGNITFPVFHPCDEDNHIAFEDYTINITPAPNCLPVSALTASTLTTSSADLAWTVGNNNATSWNIEYGALGFNQGSGTTVVATTNPYTLSNLSSNTTYDFYVQSNCNGTTTAWIGPLTFTTACINTVPYFEGFEVGYGNNSELTDCFSQESVSGTTSWKSNSNTISTPHYSGTWNAFLGYTNEDWFFIPINLTAGTSYTFGCFVQQETSTLTNAHLSVHFGTENLAIAMTDTIIPTTNIITGNYQQLVGIFTPTTTTTYYIGIKGYVTGIGNSIAIDDISVIPTPACPAPSALTTSNSTTTSTNLSWVENGTATNWEIEYGTSGFSQGSGTIISTTTNSELITNLTTNTNYDFYVRAVCSNNSTWTGPYAFFSGYCTPAPTSVDNNGITNVTIGSINNTTGPEPGHYGDYTAMVTNVYQNTTANIAITYQTSYTYYTWAWVDWNNDLDFDDAGESYFLGISTNANPTTLNSTITIPATASIGNHRLRIGGSDSGLGTTPPSTPCYTGSYASFEDYTINVITTATCLPPSSLNVSNVTATSVDLSWTENGTATAWNIEYGIAGFAQGSGTTITVTTNPFTLSGLSPNSNLTYSYYVQSDCSNETSDWSIPYTFTPPCGVYTTPFYEGFENGYTHNTAVGTCLTQESVLGSDNWNANDLFGTYNRTPRTGDWNAFLTTGNEDWLFIPIELIGGTTYDFGCFARQNGTIASYATLTVNYGTTNTVAGMTNSIISSTGIIDGTYQSVTGSFTPTTTGTYYVGIKGDIISSNTYLSLDDISISASSTCPPPVALSVSNTLGTSVDINWTENGTATAWNIEYGVTGFIQGTGTVIPTTTNPYNLSGLSPITAYSFYIQSDCNGTTSNWSGPYHFTTPCGSAVVPYFEGFENNYINNAAIGGCLTQYNSAGSAVWVANNTLTTNNRSPRTGNWNTYLASHNQDWFFIPIELNGGTTYTFECYARHDNPVPYTGTLRVYFGTTPTVSAMTNTIIPPTNLADGAYQAYFGTFTPSTNGTYYIGVRGSTLSQSAYISIDDISVTVTPVCPAPLGLNASNITATTTDLDWIETGSATTWEIEYGTVGFTQGTGTIVSATTNPFNLSGLIVNTSYDYYVRAICGSDSSTWSAPHSFITPCIFSIPYFEGFENGYTHNTTIGGCISQGNVTGSQTWMANSNFTDFNRTPLNGNWNAFLRWDNDDWLFIPVNLIGGTSYTFDGYARQDDSYATDAEIKVSYGTTANASAMTTTIVPSQGIIDGAYQQVTGMFTPPTSGVYYIGILGHTDNIFYLSLDDIAIIATPSCPSPIELTASNILYTTADLSWIETGSATSWEIEYGVSGFALGTGTSIITTSNPYSLTGLTADTNYDVYVRSICSAGDTSTWSWLESFFTGYCTPSPAYSTGQGIINVSMGSINNTTGVEPGGYGYYVSMITSIPQGGTFPIHVTYGSFYDHETWAWVDWNNDLDFDDAGEAYFLGVATTATQNTVSINSSIQVPITSAVGNHRIRIGGSDGALSSTPPSEPCYSSDDYGATFEDYTLGVTMTQPNNVGVTAIAGNCSTMGSVTIAIENAGTSAQNSMNVSYQINGGTVVTEAWSGNIAAGSTTYYTFTNTFNASTTPYPYQLKAWTTLVGDVNYSNDTLVETITTDTVFSITYTEDFETASIADWNSTGSFGTDHGSPSSVAYENLYSSGPTTFTLTSPKIGIVSAGDILTLKYRFVDYSNQNPATTLGNGDILEIKISTDCGNSFTTLGQINSSNHTPTTSMTPLQYNISAYAGQNIMILIEATYANGDYYIDIDDIFVGSLFQQSNSFTNVTCNGNMDGTASIIGNGGFTPYTYLWSNGQTASTITGLSAGNYTYTITDAGGTVLTDFVTITEPAAITVNASVDAEVSCNGFADGGVSVIATGGVNPLSYLWNTNDTLTSISGIAAGTYTITVTDASNCSVNSTTTVSEPAPLVLTTSSIADTAGMNVGSAMAIVTGGTTPYIYEWDGTVGTDILSDLITGTYTIVITDAHNCTITDSAFVDEAVNTKNIDYLMNLSIAPNPTKGNIVIDLELSKSADVSISIYTVTGVLVADFGKEHTMKQTQQIDLSNYSEGMYFIRFMIDNQVITKKLILSK